jgi:hypothetical protein
LASAPGHLAAQLGLPIFETLVRWSNASDPALRDAIDQTLRIPRLRARYGAEVERVRSSLDASRPPPRNPDHDVGPTRNRSGQRRRTGARPRRT